MKLKTMAMTGVMSLAGLGLVGAGAHAVFTTTTSSSQTISAGTVNVVVWSTGATNSLPCTSEALAIANDCTSVTLPVQNVGSTFDTTPSQVWVANVGTLPVYETSFAATYTTVNSAGLDNGGTLASELGMCIYSDGGAIYNGMLTSYPYVGYGSSTYTYPLAVATGNELTTSGATSSDSYSADFYAGMNSSQCGITAPTPPYTYVQPASLTNAAEGGSVTVTITPGFSDQP